jgi:ADP-ribose pyrophosphatase YjhB (NUDIX family)
MTEYQNPGTVVVVSVQVEDGLVMVRRALPDGYGKLALPGGYQAVGETWQEAGARELLEEANVTIDPWSLKLDHVVTVEGKINLIFCTYKYVVRGQQPCTADAETLEVITVTKRPALDDIAFETHAQAVDRFFDARLSIQDAPGALPRDTSRFKKFGTSID